MDELRVAAEKTAEFPQVLLFAMASVDEAGEFFAGRWQQARVVADRERVFYEAFGRRSGGLSDFASLRAIGRYLSAMLRGHLPGRPVGSVRVMPGMFVVRGAEIVWEHEFAHAGDHPDLDEVARIR